MTAPPRLSVVVPVFREEQAIRPFLARLRPVLERIGEYEILFCLDPAPDGTEAVIAEEAAMDSRIGLLVFSRRFGQPAATLAGVLNCRGESCVVIDVDLQDPPERIADLHARLCEGYDVVTARRAGRAGETALKRLVARLGYGLIAHIAEVPIPPDTGDFRIISRRVIEELRRLPESHGFLRGLVALVGFRQTEISYDRAPRASGTGKYNRYLGSLRIGLNGVVGFSRAPLSLALWGGAGVLVLGLAALIGLGAASLLTGHDRLSGLPGLAALMLFMGGVQLVAVGVLGEYIGRIYDEVRHRPHYIIDRAHNLPVRAPHGPGVRPEAP